MQLKIRLPGLGRRLDRIERQLRTLDENFRLIGRRLNAKMETIVTQSEQVAAAVAELQSSSAELRALLANISGDVQSLKDQIDQLPTGEPIDPAVLQSLQSEVAGLNDTVSGFRQLDESTPGNQPGGGEFE